MRTSIGISWLLGLLVLLGGALRFWQLGHGLPDIRYVDEVLVTYLSLNMGGGDLNPHDFLHPHLYYYLSFLLQVLYIAGGLLTGFFRNAEESWLLYKSDPTIYYLIGRGVSAALGTATIFLTWRVGRRLFNPRTALAAAFFVAFSFLHVQWSQIGYMDAPLCFFLMLAFLGALRAYESRKLKDFCLAGFLCGLTASVKYQGFITLIWGPLLAFLPTRESAPNQKKVGAIHALPLLRCLIFFAFFLLGFTAGTPFWLLDLPQFVRHWTFNWKLFATHSLTQFGLESKNPAGFYLSEPLAYGLGIPLLIAGLSGFGAFLLSRNPRKLFFLSFPLVYFLMASLSQVTKPSYILPLIPFLCLAAAEILSTLFANRRLFAAACLLAAFPNFLPLGHYAFLRTQEDTRILASRWAAEHFPADQKILQSFFMDDHLRYRGRETVFLDPTVFSIEDGNRSTLKSLEDYRQEGIRYLMLESWFLETVLKEGGKFPRYQGIVKRYEKWIEDLKREGKLLAAFSPAEETLPYDRNNVQIPSKFLRKMKRPGPVVWIYEI